MKLTLGLTPANTDATREFCQMSSRKCVSVDTRTDKSLRHVGSHPKYAGCHWQGRDTTLMNPLSTFIWKLINLNNKFDIFIIYFLFTFLYNKNGGIIATKNKGQWHTGFFFEKIIAVITHTHSPVEAVRTFLAVKYFLLWDLFTFFLFHIPF